MTYIGITELNKGKWIRVLKEVEEVKEECLHCKNDHNFMVQNAAVKTCLLVNGQFTYGEKLIDLMVHCM